MPITFRHKNKIVQFGAEITGCDTHLVRLFIPGIWQRMRDGWLVLAVTLGCTHWPGLERSVAWSLRLIARGVDASVAIDCGIATTAAGRGGKILLNLAA